MKHKATIFFTASSSSIIKSLRPVLKAKCGNSKEGIVAIHVPDAQPEDFITAKHLHSIEKVIETVRCYILIRKGHEGDFSIIHHVLKMSMGYCEELEPFRAAPGIVTKVLPSLRYG